MIGSLGAVAKAWRHSAPSYSHGMPLPDLPRIRGKLPREGAFVRFFRTMKAITVLTLMSLLTQSRFFCLNLSSWDEAWIYSGASEGVIWKKDMRLLLPHLRWACRRLPYRRQP
jgi:hypothetical protein